MRFVWYISFAIWYIGLVVGNRVVCAERLRAALITSFAS
jgi:hypothetical protein